MRSVQLKILKTGFKGALNFLNFCLYNATSHFNFIFDKQKAEFKNQIPILFLCLF